MLSFEICQVLQNIIFTVHCLGLLLIFSNIDRRYINSFTCSYLDFLKTFSCKWSTLFASKIFKVNQKRKTLREKCPNTKFFLVRIFPHLGWIGRESVSLSIQCKCGEIWTRKISVFGHCWIFWHLFNVYCKAHAHCKTKKLLI